MKWELAQSLLVYGPVLRAKDDVKGARDTLARAKQLFEEMGVSWGMERAEQALREL